MFKENVYVGSDPILARRFLCLPNRPSYHAHRQRKPFIADVSSNLKQAVVTPILNKNKLYKDNLDNYIPISNLSLLSKIVENIVTSRMHSFLQVQDNNVFKIPICLQTSPQH